MTYQWSATTKDGEPITGTVNATNPAANRLWARCVRDARAAGADMRRLVRVGVAA